MDAVRAKPETQYELHWEKRDDVNCWNNWGDRPVYYNYVDSRSNVGSNQCVTYLIQNDKDGWYAITIKTFEPSIMSKDAKNRRSFNVLLNVVPILKVWDIGQSIT